MYVCRGCEGSKQVNVKNKKNVGRERGRENLRPDPVGYRHNTDTTQQGENPGRGNTRARKRSELREIQNENDQRDPASNFSRSFDVIINMMNIFQLF